MVHYIIQASFNNTVLLLVVMVMVLYNIFIHEYKYIVCRMCIVLNMVPVHIDGEIPKASNSKFLKIIFL